MEKKSEVEASLGPRAQATEVTQSIAKLWRQLSPADKITYTIKAEADKERYHVEKALYTGPWTLPKPPRKKKDPSAPKRSSSAFLFYAKDRRGVIRRDNPQMVFQDVSRLLGKMWENEIMTVKIPYIEKEQSEREKYIKNTADWRRQKELEEILIKNSDEKVNDNVSLKKTVTESDCDSESCSESSCDGSSKASYKSSHLPLTEITCNESILDESLTSDSSQLFTTESLCAEETLGSSSTGALLENRTDFLYHIAMDRNNTMPTIDNTKPPYDKYFQCNEMIVNSENDVNRQANNNKQTSLDQNQLRCDTITDKLTCATATAPVATNIEKNQTKKCKASKKKQQSAPMRKHPLAPKRFKTAYILFCDSKRQKVRESLGLGSSGTQITKNLGLLWKAITPSEHKYYSRLAEIDMNRYKLEMKQYGGPYFAPRVPRRTKKHPAAPKKSSSAFLYFTKQARPQVMKKFPDLKFEGVSTFLSDSWNAMGHEEKAPFLEKELRDQARYAKEMVEWRDARSRSLNIEGVVEK